MERISYHGWSNCYQLSNSLVKLIVTTDVGPRIIFFGGAEGENVFKEFPEMLGLTAGDEWRIYGGHRLWHAPEEKPRTYFPDNSSVGIEVAKGATRLVQRTEPTTGIQKEIDIQLIKDKPAVRITHRLKNHNLWPVTLAPWALSVMAPGGMAIVPLPPRGSHEGNLLPNGSMTLWAYTDLSDKRFSLSPKYVCLRQDPVLKNPQKIGLSVPSGWAAYALHKQLFVKRFQFLDGQIYPDRGSNVELFTNGDMLEVETLGPLASLAPQQIVEHLEEWHLFHDVKALASEADIDREVLPRVSSIMESSF